MRSEAPAPELAARVELEPVAAQFRSAGWETAVGCSGTIRAIEVVRKAQGWSREGISRAGLRKLRRALLAAGHVDALSLQELRDDRKPVFAGGVAVPCALFEYLVENADMAGFSRQEQLRLAALVRGHRRKFPAAVLDSLPEPYAIQARRLCVLLRLGVVFHRSRQKVALRLTASASRADPLPGESSASRNSRLEP